MENDHALAPLAKAGNIDDSSLIFPDLTESTRALMNSLDRLEDMINLIKSDLKKPLPIDISDLDLPYNKVKSDKRSSVGGSNSKTEA